MVTLPRTSLHQTLLHVIRARVAGKVCWVSNKPSSAAMGRRRLVSRACCSNDVVCEPFFGLLPAKVARLGRYGGGGVGKVRLAPVIAPSDLVCLPMLAIHREVALGINGSVQW